MIGDDSGKIKAEVFATKIVRSLSDPEGLWQMVVDAVQDVKGESECEFNDWLAGLYDAVLHVRQHCSSGRQTLDSAFARPGKPFVRHLLVYLTPEEFAKNFLRAFPKPTDAQIYEILGNTRVMRAGVHVTQRQLWRRELFSRVGLGGREQVFERYALLAAKASDLPVQTGAVFAPGCKSSTL